MRQVKAPGQGRLFDTGHPRRFGGDLGQTPVDIPLRVLAPGPHDAIQSLAALACGDLGGSERQFRGLHRGAVPRQSEVRDVPRFVEQPAHLVRRGECLHDRLAQFQQLFIGLMLIEGGPNLHREVEHDPGDLEFGRLELRGGHPLPERYVERVQEADDHGELEIRPDSRQRKQYSGVEDRIPEQPGLHQIGLRHP